VAQLNPRQRAILADKIPDLANFGSGLFLFGQFVGNKPVSTVLFASGVAAWIMLLGAALVFERDRK
jgi:hypothetical protein